MDNYAEELKVWKECWVKWGGEQDIVEEEKPRGQQTVVDTTDGKVAEGKKGKMPGSFEW